MGSLFGIYCGSHPFSLCSSQPCPSFSSAYWVQSPSLCKHRACAVSQSMDQPQAWTLVFRDSLVLQEVTQHFIWRRKIAPGKELLTGISVHTGMPEITVASLCSTEAGSRHHTSRQRYPQRTAFRFRFICLRAATDSDSVQILISVYLQDFNKLFTNGLLCHLALSAL